MATPFVTALLLATLGCGTDPYVPIPTIATAPAVVIDVDDTSGSDRDRLPAFVLDVQKLLPFLPADTWLTVLRFDWRVGVVRDAPAPKRPTAYTKEVLPRLMPPASRPGSRFDLVLQEVARISQKATGPVVVTLHSDFRTDGMTSAQVEAARAAAAEIAANPAVRSFVLVGADVEASDAASEILAPLMPGKLVRYNVGAVDHAAVAKGLGK